jgi:cytochrome b
MMNNDAPPKADEGGTGPKGARWVIALFFIFSVIVTTGWAEGWWDNNNRITVAAPAQAPAHHSGNKVQ